MSGAQRDSGEISVAADAARPRESATSDHGSRIVVRCAGRTAVGQVRDHNEDNLVVANLGSGTIRPRDQVFEDEVGDRGLIFAVCDGMGGAAAGEVASQMAVDILVEAMRRGGSPKNRDALARRLVGAVEEAGRRIFDSAQKERSRRGMGTTATVAVLVDKVMFLAEVGDSRAYLLRRGQLKQLTKDQSLVNQLIEAGHLTEDEAEAFEHSNIILQALGTSETVQVDLTFVELRRGDRLMLCSDGLSGLVHTEAMRTTLEQFRDPAECCAKLIEFAETAGGHDNITVVVADFEGQGLAEPVESDTFGYVQYPLPLADSESSAFVDEDTTSAGGDARRNSLSDRRPLDLPEIDDEGESLLPLSGDDGGDTRANALWILGGVIALVAAVFVWFTLEPTGLDDDADSEMVLPTPKPAPTAAAGALAAPTADALEVEVNVHTDVEQATLLVNGEAKGELSAQQSRNLKLRPGAYRFEAQSDGSPAAVAVVTVRGDMPMDVFLQLPKGASPRADAQEAAAAEDEAPEPVAAERAPRPKPSPPDSTAEAPRAPATAPTPPAAAVKPPAVEPERPSPPREAVAAPTPAPTAPRRETPLPKVSDPTAGREPAPVAPAPKPADIPDNPF
jgi:protein phosphatase